MSAHVRALLQPALLDPQLRIADLLARHTDLVPADLAWAIKQACYDAWNSEPQQARRCAVLLAELADATPQPLIAALAAWTAGIAALA